MPLPAIGTRNARGERPPGDGARRRGSDGESARVGARLVAGGQGALHRFAARPATRAEAHVSGTGAAAAGEAAFGRAHVSPRVARGGVGGIGPRTTHQAYLHALLRREYDHSCSAGRNPDSFAHVDRQHLAGGENAR